MYRAGFVLFCASSDDEQSIEEAKDYVRRFGLTSEQVRITRGVGVYTSVVAKVDLELREA